MNSHRPRLGVLVHMEPGDAPRLAPSGRLNTRILSQWSHDAQVPLLYLNVDDLEWRDRGCWGRGWAPEWESDTWRFYESAPLVALYNRFPASRAPQALEQLASKADALGLPLANHPGFQAFAQDKWRVGQLFQRRGLSTPPQVLEANRRVEQLRLWKEAYLKPRYGAFGEDIYFLQWRGDGVLRVGPEKDREELLGHRAAEAWLEAQQEVVLQRAIPSPRPDLRGFCVRSLLQRQLDGTWRAPVRVARCSQDDRVCNVARGAQAHALQDLLAQWGLASRLPQLEALESALASAWPDALPSIPASGFVEIGLDALLDPQGTWWLLEINGFPQGRLSQLARQHPQRFAQAHRIAQIQPLRCLWQMASVEK